MDPRLVLSGCETYFIGIKSVSDNTVRYRLFPARCHSWDCRICAKQKAEVYKVRMRPLFERPSLYMYTLTYYHNAPPAVVWSKYAAAWNRFRTAAVKKYGKFSYVRVLEHHHNSPYPHLHILADVKFSDVWFAAELLCAGFGYQAVCKPVVSRDAVAYVTKYLTKPWTSPWCQKIRRDLHLRIVSFGGDACLSKRRCGGWQMIARSLLCPDVVAAIELDRDWEHGASCSLTYAADFDTYSEETYIFKKGGSLDAYELPAVVSCGASKSVAGSVVQMELLGGVVDNSRHDPRGTIGGFAPGDRSY